ncbi:unnamed protein product [Bursaphelenchus okinawaensis]|uniref:Insulin-like domain-containing protein n=1 Tax=Bursaphelenchus okinawaensis TaxID=465554 RepID=A0A811LNB3_9BILA|nr:unnamed protein product [Bursaphelenchus okinawaensis]CAG9127018.1 unnamed protein product [Bursaphelenchus okinawaensis]
MIVVDAHLITSAPSCFNKWMKRINYVCKYPTTKHPCFRNAKSISQDDFTATAAKISIECCSKGCRREEVEDFCCTTRGCLEKCYHKVRHHKPKYQDELASVMLLLKKSAEEKNKKKFVLEEAEAEEN